MIITISHDDIMPRMRAYLTRAGYASRVSDVSPDVMHVAREVYLDALDCAVPVALACDLPFEKFPGTVPEAIAAEDACRVEHAISEETFACLKAASQNRAGLKPETEKKKKKKKKG